MGVDETQLDDGRELEAALDAFQDYLEDHPERAAEAVAMLEAKFAIETAAAK